VRQYNLLFGGMGSFQDSSLDERSARSRQANQELQAIKQAMFEEFGTLYRSSELATV
jgi:hypothetical protein